MALVRQLLVLQKLKVAPVRQLPVFQSLNVAPVRSVPVFQKLRPDVSEDQSGSCVETARS